MIESIPLISYRLVSPAAHISAGKIIVEKAATMMNGLSTLTRKLNRPTTLNSWNAPTAVSSSSTASPPTSRLNHQAKEELPHGNYISWICPEYLYLTRRYSARTVSGDVFIYCIRLLPSFILYWFFYLYVYVCAFFPELNGFVNLECYILLGRTVL